MNIFKIKSFILNNKIEILFLSLIFVIFIFNSFYGDFCDEWDNILGGKLINNGIYPYSGFFSHHFPLPYFISSIINIFSGNNIVVFRLIFELFLAIWLISIYFYVRNGSNINTLRLYLLLIALISSSSSMNMLLAETIVAYAMLSIFLIIFYHKKIFIKDVCLISFFTFLISTSLAGFVFFSAIVYLLLLFFWSKKNKLKIRNIILFLIIVSLPYVVFIFYLLLTHSLRSFYWSNFTFNRVYYSKFLTSVSNNIFIIVFNIFTDFIKYLWFSLMNVSEKIIFHTILFIFDIYYIFFKKDNFLIKIIFTVFLIFSTFRFVPSVVFIFKNNSFYVLSLFIFANIFFQNIYNKNKLKKDISSSVFFCLSFIVIVFIVNNFLIIFNKIIVEDNLQNTTIISDKLNNLLSPNDYYWVGPFHFKEIYFTKAKLATKYTFYLPWHALSPDINKEILNDLEKNKPKIIYFDKDIDIWGHVSGIYASQIINYLNNNYTQFTETDYKNFYKLNTL